MTRTSSSSSAATQVIPGGFVLLARKTLKSDLWQAPPAWLKLWVLILLRADRKTGQASITFSRGNPDFAGISRDQYQRGLAWLEHHEGSISTKRCQRGVIVQVQNWGRYQTMNNYRELPLGLPPTQSTPKTSTSWLAPYAEAWRQVMDGEMNCKAACRPLAALEKQHGPEKTLLHFRHYLADAGPRFFSFQKFSSTFGTWSQPGGTTHGKRPTSRNSLSTEALGSASKFADV